VTRQILFLVENQPYPYDPRVRSQIETLHEAGHEGAVLGPTGYGHDSLDEVLDGVQVHRFRAPPAGRGTLGYAREFAVAMARTAAVARRLARRRRFDVVVVCSPPDVLIALAKPFRRRGAAVVFDDRELSPELFEAKFGRRGVVFALLLRMERYAFRRADAVLVTNAGYVENATGRGGVPADRVFVVGNGPDPGRVFAVDPRPELKRGRRHLVLWLGAMSTPERVDLLVDAARVIVREQGRDDVTFAIAGPGDVNHEVAAQIARLGLENHVVMPGRLDDDLVRAYISTADVCVNTDQPNAMNDRAAMRKVLEYMALGRAVVQYPLAEMQRLCGDATVYAQVGSVEDLARRITELLDDPAARQALGEAGRRRIEDKLGWQHQGPVFLAALDKALAVRSGREA
jgi:glycosyltransferase involved in cell wall biosynthesis